MAYKKLIKVSNVCQLLDKSKYPSTQTINGVTFTNNGDGTITANGTATSGAGFRLSTFYIEANRTYLMTGCPEGGGAGKYFMFDGYSKLGSDLGSGIIKTVSGSDRTLCSPILYVVTGQTVSNLVFKPQLFDLTEMYRAGHEPTTVEQFRQDFPEEMYDYSPHCWLTSYKRVFMTGGGNYLTSYQRNLTCKTKNLFKASLIYLKPGVSVSGNSITYDGKSSSPSSSNLPVYLSLGTFSSLFSLLSVGETYTFSCTVVYDGENPLNDISFRVILYNPNDPNFSIIYLVNPNQIGYCSSTFTVTEAFLDCHVVFYGYNSGIPCTWKNIMVNKGDTATDYVPYGHL